VRGTRVSKDRPQAPSLRTHSAVFTDAIEGALHNLVRITL
jgi:hypothetical protein